MILALKNSWSIGGQPCSRFTAFNIILLGDIYSAKHSVQSSARHGSSRRSSALGWLIYSYHVILMQSVRGVARRSKLSLPFDPRYQARSKGYRVPSCWVVRRQSGSQASKARKAQSAIAHRLIFTRSYFQYAKYFLTLYRAPSCLPSLT